MECQQCGRPALIAYDNGQVRLCLDCNLKFIQANAIQQRQLERQVNAAYADMDAIVGLSPSAPPFPEGNPVHLHGATFHNIRVENSAVGMINTGAIETVDAAVTAINASGEPDLGRAFAELCEAVVADGELDEATKNKLLEMLSLMSTEATAPKEHRRSSAIRPVLQEVASLLGGSVALATLWEKIKPLVDAAFN